jgi:hypothetical protein
MAVVNSNLLMEMFTVVNIKMVDLMELVHMNGKLMGHFIKAVLKMGLDMEKENGIRDKLNITEVIAKA